MMWSLHKKLFVWGIALIIVPISIGVASSALSDCFGHYAYVPFLLGIINTFLEFLTQDILGTLLFLCIPLGFILSLWSYGVWRRNKGTSKLAVLRDVVGILILVGLLLSVVLASLNTARYKGPLAGFKSSMHYFRAQAELHYDEHERSYAGFCSSPEYKNIEELLMLNMDNEFGGFVCSARSIILNCKDSEIGYVISAPLPINGGDNYYCVDSTGFVGEVTGPVEGKSCVGGSDEE